MKSFCIGVKSRIHALLILPGRVDIVRAHATQGTGHLVNCLPLARLSITPGAAGSWRIRRHRGYANIIANTAANPIMLDRALN